MSLLVLKRKTSFFKDIAVVSLGNIIFLLSNILVGFLLPVILGVTGYGYYRIYILYTSYCGLLHFGFTDGILLEYAGKKYNDLNRYSFRRYSRSFIAFEVMISTITVLFALFFCKNEYRWLLSLVGVNIVLYNVTLYFQYISQAVSRYKEFSVRKILTAIGTVILVFVFYIGHIKDQNWAENYYIYIVLTLLLNFLLLLWYLYTYRELIFGKCYSFNKEKSSILKILKTGIIMTIAYETSRLVLVIDQQFVSLLFDVNTYSQYSFAYNILSCVTAIITGISTVMLPKLKQSSRVDAIKKFDYMMAMVSTVVCLSLVGYHPIRLVIIHFMPMYVDALIYFEIIFPVLALSSCITIVIFTYYKILNKNIVYLISCLVSLIISAVFNFLAYLMFGTAVSISMATVVTTIIWYLISIRYLNKKYHVKWKRNFFYIICMISIFYITAFAINNIFLSSVAYLILYILFTMCIFKKLLKKILRR